MAMHAWEAKIMRLWDAGASIEAIACNTAMRADLVRKIVSRYHNASSDRATVTAMRRGSAYLLKAIQLSGKRHRSVGR